MIVPGIAILCRSKEWSKIFLLGFKYNFRGKTKIVRCNKASMDHNDAYK